MSPCRLTASPRRPHRPCAGGESDVSGKRAATNVLSLNCASSEPCSSFAQSRLGSFSPGKLTNNNLAHQRRKVVGFGGVQLLYASVADVLNMALFGMPVTIHAIGIDMSAMLTGIQSQVPGLGQSPVEKFQALDNPPPRRGGLTLPGMSARLTLQVLKNGGRLCRIKLSRNY